MIAAVGRGTESGYYVFGGQRSVHGPMETVCLKYSVQTNAWAERAPMAYRRGLGQAVGCGGLIYVLGGCTDFGTGLSVVEVYDPAADTWGLTANMPESLHDFGAAVWRDSLIYVLGGGNWAASSPPTDQVWLFDPGNLSWRSATHLPLPVGAFAGAIFGDTILVATGWTSAGPTSSAWLGTIDPADPSRILWAQFDSMPDQPRCRAVAAGLDGRLCIVGGVDPAGSVCREAWSADPHTGSWQPLSPKPLPVSNVFGGVALNHKLYVPGGYPGAAPFLAAHEVLDMGLFGHDVGVGRIISPLGRLVPGTSRAVAIAVENLGSSGETLTARARIVDTIDRTTVFVAESTVALVQGQSLPLGLGDFIPRAGRVFSVTASVSCAGDENPENDTLRATCRTTIGSEPDRYGYTYESTQEPDTVRFDWLDPAGSDTIRNWTPNPDDGLSVRHLPFGFPFYDVILESLRLCTNGFLTSTDLACPENLTLPSFDHENLIAPFWDDLTLRSSGAVLENLLPDKALFTWVNVPRYGAPAESLTFQVVLYRNGTIRFNYLSLAADRRSSTVGIQGHDGSWRWYLEYFAGGEPVSHVPSDSMSVLFRPPFSGIAEQKTPPRSADITLSCPTLLLRPELEVHWSTAEPPRLSLFDPAGRCVLTRSPGHSVTRSLRLDLGRLASGAYFIRASAGPRTTTKKIIIPGCRR